MAEQIGVALPFTAFYTTLGVGTTGLTVTADVYRNGTEIVAAGSATDAGDGLYTYTLASGSNTVEGVYIAVFKTATTTVDQQHIAAVWEVGTGGIENLDAAVSSRSVAGDAMALTSGERTTVSSSVWSSATRTLTSYGTLIADIWSYVTRTLTSGGGGGGATAQEVWEYATRELTALGFAPSLTVAVSETDAVTVSSGSMSFTSYVTFTQSVTSTLSDDLSAATKLWLSVKDDVNDPDSKSLVFIEETAGLTYCAKSAYGTAGDGSLVVSGSTGAWSVAVTLKAAASGLLHGYHGSGKVAQLKAIIGGNVVVVWSGNAVISRGVVQAIA